MITNDQIVTWFQTLQEEICCALEQADGLGIFKQDLWQRAEGGGGRTRVMANGQIIEKGGVNFSAVYGDLPEKVAQNLKTEAQNFLATGVSIVLHPYNPMMPIIHMNVRYFSMQDGTWWFGGGIDLTPHYIDDADACYFHKQLKAVCDLHDATYYARFKNWADEYFFIRHRNETRGVGGIFFDRLSGPSDQDKTLIFEFVKDVGKAFAPIYTYFMKKNSNIPFTEQHKTWQSYRRGRYVEFNLVWDAGTKFGLETNGRTESILMSMPPMAQWVYDYTPESRSAEALTLSKLKKGLNWIDMH